LKGTLFRSLNDLLIRSLAGVVEKQHLPNRTVRAKHQSKRFSSSYEPMPPRSEERTVLHPYILQGKISLNDADWVIINTN
jgi:hypothetical protein